MGLRLKSNGGKDGLRKCKNNKKKQKARKGERSRKASHSKLHGRCKGSFRQRNDVSQEVARE